MESGSCSSSSEAKQDIENLKVEKKFKNEEKKNKGCSEHVSRAKVKNFKPSMIPVIKNEKIDAKSFVCKRRPSSSKSLNASKIDRRREDFDYKLKLLEEKEKSIAEYYSKIEEMIRMSMAQKKDEGSRKSINRKICEDSSARKMTSDPSVFSKRKTKSEITEFENNIQQISHIWLKTTSDLTSTLKNIKCNSGAEPADLQMENLRIQLAIKQAKSLTLVKTRSVIAEAKKLFRNREMIRSELQCLLGSEKAKTEPDKSQKVIEDKSKTLAQQNTEEQAIDGTGDSLKETDTDSLETERIEKETSIGPSSKSIKGDNFSEEIDSDEIARERIPPECSFDLEKVFSEMENLKKELCKKNKTITNLNKKIFDLQKTCNENSVKYNQLQTKLFEFHEKIQWNQVLWKQIGKLKERIKGIQQTNKELECQKKELECKVVRREQEIDRLLKINHVLNQKKRILDAHDVTMGECGGHMHGQPHEDVIHEKYIRRVGNKIYIDEKVIAEKQSAINELKKILKVMKDQENFAQKRISMFQSRIEELEKNAKV